MTATDPRPRPRPVRLVAVVLAGTLAVLGAAACGDDTGGDDTAAGTATETGSGGTFPVTIDHAQGSATIETRPERVVAVGVADIQIAAALGAPIVGAVRNPTSEDGTWYGVDPALPADVTLLGYETPNLEQIAALRPDVILATTAYPGYGDAYDELSAIAPVVSYKSQLLGDSGDELTTMIGDALGQPDAATELIESSHRAVEEFVAARPGLEGKTYALGQYYEGSLQVLAGQDTPSVQFLATFGLSVPDELAALDNGGLPSGMASLSAEQIELLDTADAAYIRPYGDGAAQQLDAEPLVTTLRLTRQGALHHISDDLMSLLFSPNPAVTDHILDDFGPYLDQLAGS
jgi:iron complex transport system substrate-binding protein